ncbi:MAG: FAD-dependent oxidoreductase, partial [Deltaproteobacteria bacterium]|nr:FAD-dependent oxidoreductase [Deltaproteobacteria bacterium]
VNSTRLWTPKDMERELGLPGGQLEHGEMALDQILVRPTPKTVGYRSPVPGLLLASSGSHPGGGINGLPGKLAASAILSQ